MRALKRQIASVAVLGVLSALAFAGLSLADAGPIEPVGTTSWSLTSVTINVGEKVSFKNTSGTPHGVTWTTTSPSSCTETVLNGSGTSGSFNGSCTFNQGGDFPFRCTLHPVMTGTVHVNGGPEKPVITAKQATSVTETGATLNGEVNPRGQATSYWFEYGTSTSYGHETSQKSAGTGGALILKSEPVTGLEKETTYHFRMVAENPTGTTEGGDLEFRTPGPVTVTTEPATGVGGVEATLVGKINPNGWASAKYFFNWGTTAAYGHKTLPEKSISGMTLAPKTEPISGLAPNTTYHFQVVLKYGASGEEKGLDETFTTLNVPPPLATTGSATGISTTGATVEGTVNPKGQSTTYFFNYGLTSSYGSKTADFAAGNGSAAKAVSALLAELVPNTTYHYQLVAHSAGGTTPGTDQTFTTANVVVPPEEEHKPPVEEPKPPPEVTPPDTTIAPKPPAKTHDRTPTIKFKASVGGATFQCSVDSKPFKACRSPFTAPSLKPGRHRIRVKAVAGGVSDPTPASCSIKVLAKKKK